MTSKQFANTPAIMDEGERVTHLYPNSCYYAHLSIYQFALAFVQGADVLDAGCGSGYGSHYLAERGARSVLGIDASAKAVAFSQSHFQHPKLTFRCLNLEEAGALPAGTFDVIFTSNTLEHVANVGDFFAAASALLRPEGQLIVAVPPIYNASSREANLANPYHVNIWSPRQWHYTLGRYFRDVNCIRHHFEKPGVPLDFFDTPETTPLRENDFLFLPSSVDELCAIGALTAIFVAAHPLPIPQQPALHTPAVFADDSFTRELGIRRGLGATLRAQASAYWNRIAQLR